MKRSLMTIAILSLCSGTFAQLTPAKPDVREFQITPAAIPEPALKYQIMFDDLGDRRPGNAALLYHETILLLGPDTKDKTEKALDAYQSHDLKTFDSMADSMELPNVFQELDLAGRRDHCDWEPPFREMGAFTLLPHLEPLAHATSRLIKIRALRQIEQGKIDDAIRTLRLGYEMSNNVGQEQVLIAGLVSLSITSQMNDALMTLMNSPEAPNLYWALREFPSRHGILRHSMDGERSWWITIFPRLAGGMEGQNLGQRIKSGESLTPEQWRAFFAYVNTIVDANPDLHAKHPDPVKAATPKALEDAKAYYAAEHHLTAEQAAAVDPIVVLGEYYFSQYQIQFDNMFRLRGLPYPEMLSGAKQAHEAALRARDEQGGNPFFEAVMDMTVATWRFAHVDRQMAALASVEAISAYAAAHDGKLPAKLDDMENTAPRNSATEKPFEYHVENNVATLSDTQSQTALTYTIRIRKSQ